MVCPSVRRDNPRALARNNPRATANYLARYVVFHAKNLGISEMCFGNNQTAFRRNLICIYIVINRIYDGVEVETRKSQACFQII